MTSSAETRSLIIWGAGGHAKVVAEVARACGWKLVGFLDDNPTRHGEQFAGATVCGSSEFLLSEGADRSVSVFVAIGSNSARARATTMSEAAGYTLPVLIHPSAVVSPTATLGAGTVIMAMAVVQADTRIGRGCIVNTGSSVDHDCQLGDFVHTAPGARLAGGVTVGSQTLIGIGAVVIPGQTIGHHCVVGAGAAVVSAVPDGQTVVGVPARRL